MPWYVDVSTVESIIDDVEKALYACGQMMATGIVRAKFARTVEMRFIDNPDDHVRAELTIPNHGGAISGD
jgi:hypothetical protein